MLNFIHILKAAITSILNSWNR